VHCALLDFRRSSKEDAMTNEPLPLRVPHDDDADTNPSSNPTLRSVVETFISRRQLLRGTAGAAAMAVFGGLPGSSAAAPPNGHGSRALQLDFLPVAKNRNDAVTIPDEYDAQVLYRLGDPIRPDVPAYMNNNVDGAASSSVTTYVGQPPGELKLRRFLVGPKECDIQHPGEEAPPNFATSTFGSHWPDGGLSRPRSSTIAITRNDGGVVGVS
jgi:secreted PhoX family phosphatase